jgi:hypothetical protein
LSVASCRSKKRAPPPPPPRALFDLIKKLTKETELFLDLWSLIPYTRDFERAWSSPLRGRHRTMAANPNPRLRGKRAHTETTVLGLLKKSQQNRAPAFESRQITAKRFVGPRNLPNQLIGCSGLCPLDPIGLDISTERAQGHLLSPWSKSGAFYTKEPRRCLCMCISTVWWRPRYAPKNLVRACACASSSEISRSPGWPRPRPRNPA